MTSVWKRTLSYPGRIRETFSELPDIPEGPILDWGCGPGYTSSELAQHYRRKTIGVDILDSAISQAIESFGDDNDLEFILGDGISFLERNQKYAAIFACNNLLPGLDFGEISEEIFLSVFDLMKNRIINRGVIAITGRVDLSLSGLILYKEGEVEIDFVSEGISIKGLYNRLSRGMMLIRDRYGK